MSNFKTTHSQPENTFSLSLSSKENEDFFVLGLSKTLENPFFLSSHVMQWRESVYIFDMRPVKSYWLQQSQKKDMNLELFFSSKIEEWLEFEFNQKIDYQGVFCSHPWQGLVLLESLPQRSQILYFSSPLGKRYLNSLNWDQWFNVHHQFIGHLSSDSEYRKKEFSQVLFMKRAMQRLRVSKPIELKSMETSAITRRFGALLGKLWGWTFFQSLKQQEVDLFSFAKIFSGLQGFPWKSIPIKKAITVQRNLEYSLCEWKSIEEELRHDLQKLTGSILLQTSERLTELSWKITLYNLEEHCVRISFRHPYDLRSESFHFKTALLQFYYAFEGLAKELKKRESYLDLPEFIPVIAWEILVSQKINSQPQDRSFLFSLQDEGGVEQIIHIENQLPINLYRFQLQNSFVFTKNYSSIEKNKKSKKSKGDDLEMSHLICRAGINRPLYVFKEPQSTETPRSKKFLERVSSRWWSENNLEDYDLYQCEQQDKNYWIAKDSQDQWVKYGLFS